MNQSFSIGESILYGANGVCRVAAIEQKDFAGSLLDYYVLEPTYTPASRIYVPMNNDALVGKMRRVLSADEVRQLVRNMPRGEDEWIEDEMARRENFKAGLTKGDPTEVIRIIRTIYRHQQELKAAGKKLRQADERTFREAEKLLYDEFATVLQLQPEEVLPFILKELGEE